jgi:hypothetical protein
MPNAGNIRKDFQPPKSNNRILYGAILLGVVFLASLLLYGLESRYNLNMKLARLFGSEDSIILGSYPGKSASTIVMLVQRNGRSEIRTFNVDTRVEEFLSDPTIDSFDPIPSPNNNKVAYFINDEQGHISLLVGQPNTDPIEIITVKYIEKVFQAGFEICDEDQVIWSTGGEKIATFICSSKSNDSYLLTTVVGEDDIKVFRETKGDLNRKRSLVWVNSNQIAYTKGENDSDVIYIIEVSDIGNKPTRLFGP